MIAIRKLSCLSVGILSVAYLSSCATKPTLPTGAPSSAPTAAVPLPKPTPRPVQQPQQPAIQQPAGQSAQRHYGSFSDWKDDFISRTSRTHDFAQVNQLFGGASLNQQVIRLDGSQAEFAKMPWEYVNSAVSANRISQGKQKRREQLDILTQNENRYGVPASIVTAIWGMESSFGAGMGNTNLVDALSSLAYEGRRREFAENQLVSMLAMMERGDVYAEQLKGSWAGGMGHTQFIPSTWLVYGVDGNYDGRKNPWTVADALSSTAHYLSQSGWTNGLPAYIEVRLPTLTPAQFNQNFQGTKSFDTWRNLGVSAMNGESLAGGHSAQLWLPAGINGPALLITSNFDVIKVYNNSSSYALAVAALANGINGKPTISASWPSYESGLSRMQIENLQRVLTTKGYDTKGIDGVAGNNTRLAFARWQADNGRFADGFISQNSAQDLLWQ